MTLQRGNALENAITGERGVVRYGTTESGGTLLVAVVRTARNSAVDGWLILVRIIHAAHSSFAEGS